MSNIVGSNFQIGKNLTPSDNYHFKDNGIGGLTLYKGNIGTETTPVLSIDSSGNVTDNVNPKAKQNGDAQQTFLTAPATLGTHAVPLAQTVGRKNWLDNGNFDIWQINTTQSSSGLGSTDRWQISIANTCTFSRADTDVPVGSRFVGLWTTGGANSYAQLRQYMPREVVYKMRGKTFTASALVKCSAAYVGNAFFEILYSTTTDTATTFSGTSTAAPTIGQIVSSGYTKITSTFTVPMDAIGLYIGILPNTTQASGQWQRQGQVQVEEGTVATAYEYTSFSEELINCQRYYRKSYDYATFAGSSAQQGCDTGVWINTTDFYDYGGRTLRGGSMRNTPAITIYASGTGTSGSVRNLSGSTDVAVTTRYIGQSSYSVYTAAGTINSAAGWHWVANAELL